MAVKRKKWLTKWMQIHNDMIYIVNKIIKVEIHCLSVYVNTYIIYIRSIFLIFLVIIRTLWLLCSSGLFQVLTSRNAVNQECRASVAVSAELVYGSKF